MGLFHPLQAYMQDRDISVHCIPSMEGALQTYVQREYCLVILNLKRIGRSCAEMMNRLKMTKSTPILMITPALSPERRIELFQMGAHAYIEQPENADICIAQANALIQLNDKKSASDWKDELVFGHDLMINPRCHQVQSNGKFLELTRKEFDLLYFFAQYPYQVFSREQLYAQVWKDDYSLCGDDTVKVHIGMLRKKLKEIEGCLIQNVWGIGYKFIPPG